MKILIDINHPAHVHYFRNFIRLMKAEGHQFCVVNRDGKMINQLLDAFGIEHIVRNPRPEKRGTAASLKYLWKMVRHCYRASRKFRPDLYMGFGSAPCAITSFLFRKPCILLEDTEHNSMNHRLYKPFVDKVLTPFYFEKELWPSSLEGKQVRINAYIEQLYLHSRYFTMNGDVLSELGLEKGKYVVARFTAFDAHHDMVVRPLSREAKKSILEQLSKKYRIVLSLESVKDEADPELAPYILKFSPEKIHDIMAGAAFVITEGGTMASEAFVLGIPYIFLSPLLAGNLNYQAANYPDQVYMAYPKTGDNGCATVEEFVYESVKNIEDLVESTPDYFGMKRRTEIERQTQDPTQLLKKFVEDYMSSRR